MAQILIFLPTSALFPVSFFLSIAARMIKRAGFDGVEVLLQPRADKAKARHAKTRAIATANGLLLHWHEIWSLEDNPSHWFNYVLAWLGWITKKTEPLTNQLPYPGQRPVVCYGHRAFDFLCAVSANYWFQTCDVMSNPMDYKAFVEIVKKYNLPIVFDTQHILELVFGVSGVEKLVIYSDDDLNTALAEAWGELRPYVREIHFNNFVPRWGHTLGRNVFPDKGVLNLRAFARLVRSSGWEGVVTPEVTPRHLFPMGIPFTPFGMPFAPRLRKLHDLVRDMFS